MPRPIEQQRCHVCGQKSLQRGPRPYETSVSHDGRPPVRIVIPDLEVVACTNPNCRPAHPDDTVLLDDSATWRITEETYRQLGLLTPGEIRRERERLNLTQQELQELLGLGGNSLSRWENGHVYQARSLDTLLRIVFGVPEALRFCRQRRGTAEIPFRERFPALAPGVRVPAARASFDPARFFVGELETASWPK